MERLSRRSFMKIAGAATGAAALAAAPPIARAAIGEEGAEHDRSDDRRARGAGRRVRARRTARRGDGHLRHRRAHVPRPGPRAAAACARADRKGGELDVVPSRSTGDQPGPGRRQHRRLRVRQPGQARHGHDHHQLRPARRTRPAARTSSSSATTSSTRSTSTTTATRMPDIDVPVPVHDTSSGTRTRSSTTPARSTRSTSPNWNKRQFYDVTHGSNKGKQTTTDGKVLGKQPAPARRATSARARRRTTTALAAGRRSTRCRPARRCSPASGTTAFFVDLGAIFDLGDLRPFQNLHLIPPPAATSVDPLDDAERAHDRDPGPDHEADAGRLGADATR